MAAKRIQRKAKGTSKFARAHSREIKLRHLISLTILLTHAFVAVAYGSYSIITRPQGRIISPGNNAITDRLVEIKGYTKHLPPDRHYIWVAVDVPRIKLCWPKRRIYTINDRFKTKIDERGPNKTFTVSIYAVNRDYHEQIQKWRKKIKLFGSEEGLPLLPEGLKLDSVVLELGNP